MNLIRISYIIDSSSRAIDPEGREVFFSYNIEDLIFEGSTEKLLSFNVKFRNVDRLMEGNLLARFQSSIGRFVGKKIGGQWDSEDLIFKTSEIVFRRER